MIFDVKVIQEFTPFNDLLSYIEVYDGRQMMESYAEHALRAYYHWKALKERVITGLSRVLQYSKDDIDFGVSLGVLLHDAGKLTTLYQEYLNRKLRDIAVNVGFAHEVISAQILLDCLSQINFDKIFNYLISAAVLFHHEAIRQQESRQRVDKILSPIYNRFKGGIIEFSPKSMELLKKLVKRILYIDVEFNENISINDMKKSFIYLFQFLDPDSSVHLHIIRLRVAALHQIISVCDNRAALEVRPRRNYPFIREVMEGGWKY
jgi:CRISPR-associated endonuclease Cas3-HD